MTVPNKIMKSVFGSHLYKLNTPDSDTDYKGIYLPTLNDLLLNTYKPVINLSSNKTNIKNSNQDIDEEWISLPKFLEFAIKGETVSIDMLHSTDVEYFGEYKWIWEELITKRKEFYTSSLPSYLGYVKRQAAKYGIKGSRVNAHKQVLDVLEKHIDDVGHGDHKLSTIWDKLPTGHYLEKFTDKDVKAGDITYYCINGKKHQSGVRIAHVYDIVKTAYDRAGKRALLAAENSNVDWKALSHALRAGYQLRSIFVDGDYDYPLTENKFILEVKQGKLDFVSIVEPALEQVIKDVEILSHKSKLPKVVDKEK